VKARGRQSLAARLVRKSAGSYPMVQYARNVMAVTEVPADSGNLAGKNA
jgi:hypothetical protein